LRGYPDCDGDGWGDLCDCQPLIASAHPGATEICDGVDSNCDGALLLEEADVDADAWAECEGDCDEADPSRNPGATEICNQIDENCDGRLPADEADEADADGDTWALCAGDCGDEEPLANPGAVELCRNGFDVDCDTFVGAEEDFCPAELCVIATIGAPGE
jgi:hypothetical protein